MLRKPTGFKSLLRWLVKTIRIVKKIHQSVTIVDLHLHKPQCAESEDAGDFRARAVADVGKIDGHDVLVLLAEVSKLQSRLIRPRDLIHSSAYSFHSAVRIAIDLCDLSRSLRRHQVTK